MLCGPSFPPAQIHKREYIYVYIYSYILIYVCVSLSLSLWERERYIYMHICEGTSIHTCVVFLSVSHSLCFFPLSLSLIAAKAKKDLE